MNKTRIEALYSRFGITPQDGAEQTRFQNRIVRIWLNFQELTGNIVTRDQIERSFACFNGSAYKPPPHVNPSTIKTHFSEALPFTELARLVQFLVEAVATEAGNSAQLFFADVIRAIDVSPGINLRLENIQGKVELMPAGVAQLDDSLVDPALQWLAAYPDVQKEFRNALTILAEKDRDKYRQAQDSLRAALEKLLKIVLGNNLPLEEQKKPLKVWLLSKGAHDDFVDLVASVMDRIFKAYQNAAVKHDNDVGQGEEKRWSDFEVEYLIYQAAMLFRLLMEAARS